MNHSRIAECVDLESANITRQHHKVLECGRKHMPRIEIEEAHQEINANRTSRANNQIGKDIIANLDLCFPATKTTREGLDNNIK